MGPNELAPKVALFAELANRLEKELHTLEAAQRATLEAATHEEARPENDKDTRALEQSYLARGQARRVEELRTALAETRATPVRSFDEGAPIALSALVAIEDERGEQRVLIALHGGGEVLSGGERVVTPSSPLGQALLGKTAGDEVEVRQGTRVRTVSVLAVR
jgi:transcription elongation GreA/GreB family factor